MVLGAAGLACGKNRMLMDVDVTSFMDEADLVNAYDAPPLESPPSMRLDPVGINLIEGFQDFGEPQAVTLDLVMRFENTSGQGRGHVLLYFDADQASTFAAPAVVRIDVDLRPGETTIGTATVQLDDRVLALFSAKQMWMGVDYGVESESTDRLQGTCTIAGITAHMVSTMDIF
jgi:hypothetical protein